MYRRKRIKHGGWFIIFIVKHLFQKRNEERFCIQDYSSFVKNLKSLNLHAELSAYLKAFGVNFCLFLFIFLQINISAVGETVFARQLRTPTIKYRQEDVEFDSNCLHPWKTSKNLKLLTNKSYFSWTVFDLNTLETEKKQE